MSKRELPEINAGSMADIAFLLLIFFLVTTTMDVDTGILKKISQKHETPTEVDINERNILAININLKNELFVNGAVIQPEELKQIAINFIDNGGGVDKNNAPCDWCEGDKIATLSDHPTKAFISIKTDRATNYETYITVLDNLNSAYSVLRNRLAVKLYNQNYTSLLEAYKKSKNKDETIHQKIMLIREKYPLLVLEAEIILK